MMAEAHSVDVSLRAAVEQYLGFISDLSSLADSSGGPKYRFKRTSLLELCSLLLKCKHGNAIACILQVHSPTKSVDAAALLTGRDGDFGFRVAFVWSCLGIRSMMSVALQLRVQ